MYRPSWGGSARSEPWNFPQAIASEQYADSRLFNAEMLVLEDMLADLVITSDPFLHTQS